MKKYKAAITGLGNVAWRYAISKSDLTGKRTHSCAFLSNKNVELVAACDPSPEARKEFKEHFQDVAVFENMEEMFKHQEVDIISICSPDEFHFEHAKKALTQNIKMLWLEKPPALAINDIEELIKESKKQNVPCLVNFIRRYAESYQSLLKYFDDPKYGTPSSIKINFSRGLEKNGSHLLDILVMLCPNFDKYELVQKTNKSTYSSILRYDDLEIIICDNNVPYHCLDFELTTTTHRITILYNGIEMKVEESIENPDFPGFYILSPTKEGSKKLTNPGVNFDLILEDLIDAYENKSSPKSNLTSSLATIRLIDLLKGENS